MELERHEFVLDCETGRTKGGVRKSCQRTACFNLRPSNSSDGAIIDASFDAILLRGSEHDCSTGTFGQKNGYNGSQYHEICFAVRARGEKGGGDGIGKSGIARCLYKVDYIRSPGTNFDVVY